MTELADFGRSSRGNWMKAVRSRAAACTTAAKRSQPVVSGTGAGLAGADDGVSLAEMQSVHRAETSRDGGHNTHGLDDHHHYGEFYHQGH